MNLFACPGVIILALADVTSQLLNIFQSKRFFIMNVFLLADRLLCLITGIVQMPVQGIAGSFLYDNF
jgi:hypothetical protein